MVKHIEPGQLRQHLEMQTPGQVGHYSLDYGAMASGARLAAPIIVIRGTRLEPTLWVNAAVHGDEVPATITAVMFARQMGQESERRPLAGSIIITPVANPSAFDGLSKHSPFDGVDMDQSFPGRRFTITERNAATLFAEIEPLASAAVNLHSMAPFIEAANYCVMKSNVTEKVSDDDLLLYSSYFSPFVSCFQDVSGQGELAGRISGGLDYQMLLRGKPAFMVEVGGGAVWHANAIDTAVAGLTSLAAELKILGQEQAPRPDRVIVVTKRTHLTVRNGGLFRAYARPGTSLAAGDLIGEVINVHGQLVEEVRAEHDLKLIGVRRDPKLHAGGRVGFAGTEFRSQDL